MFTQNAGQLSALGGNTLSRLEHNYNMCCTSFSCNIGRNPFISPFLAHFHDGGDLNESPPRWKKKPIIICGDLNVAAMPIDLARPKANEGNPGYSPQEREKFSALLESGYVDSFRHLHPDEQKYSWWSYRAGAREKNIGWRIDYFLVSDFAKDGIVSADILTDVYGSDHCPVMLEFNP